MIVFNACRVTINNEEKSNFWSSSFWPGSIYCTIRKCDIVLSPASPSKTVFPTYSNRHNKSVKVFWFQQRKQFVAPTKICFRIYSVFLVHCKTLNIHKISMPSDFMCKAVFTRMLIFLNNLSAETWFTVYEEVFTSWCKLNFIFCDLVFLCLEMFLKFTQTSKLAN